MHPNLSALAALGAATDGVVSRTQIAACAVSRQQLWRWVAAGHLVRLGAHSYGFPGHPPTWRRALRAALIDAGDGAVVAGRSAAALHRFDGFAGGPLQTLTLRPGRGRSTVSATTQRLDPFDVVDVDGFATTSMTRTIIDLARECSADEIANAIDSAVRFGGTSPGFLRRRLVALGRQGRAGVRMLDAVLVDSGGTNRLERAFLRLCREAGLPRPATQVVHRHEGRTIARVDFDFHPVPVVAETEGAAGHGAPRQRSNDARRRRQLAARGVTVLTFTFEDVFDNPAMVAADLRAAFAREAVSDRLQK